MGMSSEITRRGWGRVATGKRAPVINQVPEPSSHNTADPFWMTIWMAAAIMPSAAAIPRERTKILNHLGDQGLELNRGIRTVPRRHREETAPHSRKKQTSHSERPKSVPALRL